MKVDDKEHLIELVRSEFCLWDHRIKGYHNRDIKPQLWESIGKKLYVTGEVARKTWENLRDTFRRKIKLHYETGQDGTDSDKWPYFNNMLFLKDILLRKENLGNLNQSPNQNLAPECEASVIIKEEPNFHDDDQDSRLSTIESGTSTSFVIPQPEQHEPTRFNKRKKLDFDLQAVEIDQDTCLSTIESGTPASFVTPKPQRHEPKRFLKRKKNDYDLQVLEIEKRKVALMEQRFGKQSHNRQDDEDYAFFMSLLPSVKQLDQLPKMKLRLEIMRNVTEALEAHITVNEGRPSRDIPPSQ